MINRYFHSLNCLYGKSFYTACVRLHSNAGVFFFNLKQSDCAFHNCRRLVRNNVFQLIPNRQHSVQSVLRCHIHQLTCTRDGVLYVYTFFFFEVRGHCFARKKNTFQKISTLSPISFAEGVNFSRVFLTHRSVHIQLVSVFTVKTNTYRLESSEYYYLIAKVTRTAFKLFKPTNTKSQRLTVFIRFVKITCIGFRANIILSISVQYLNRLLFCHIIQQNRTV